MIELRSLLVRSFDLDHLDLFWEFKDISARVDRYSIFVDRSVDGPVGPFRQIAGPFFNTNQLRDPDVNQFHNYRQYFYRLRIIDKDTDSSETTEAVSFEAEPDLIAIELRRKMELAMREFGGRQCIIFPRITSGFRCTICYKRNDKGMGSGRKLTQNCESCFDTTFVGGFTSPLIAHVQIDSSPKSVVRSDTYERNPEDTSSRLSAFPPLKPKDIIVEAENIRWEVQRVPGPKKGRATTHQEPILHRIPRHDVRYKLPVNVDVLQKFGPEREFTRPMCLPDEDEDHGGNLGDFLDRLTGE